ncbi:MAG TPA: hypothetical protein VJA47_06225 [archaeon]|nr:hypothetical protein [archaeon]
MLPVPELIEMEIRPSSSTHPSLGTYKSPGHLFRYSKTLTRTGKNYYDLKAQIPEGSRMSTAAEDLAIQLPYERIGRIVRAAKINLGELEGKDFGYIASALNLDEMGKADLKLILDIEGGELVTDPRMAKPFNDLFARENNGWYAWQWTETGLRVPKGWEDGRSQKDAKGNIYVPRIVLIGDQEVDETPVPEGNGRVVVEWNEVFGIPSLTTNEGDATNQKNHTTHFYLNANPDVDERTGRQDVAVARGSRWHDDVHVRCLSVRARYGRWYADGDVSFRQVQGSVPVIEKLPA